MQKKSKQLKRREKEIRRTKEEIKNAPEFINSQAARYWMHDQIDDCCIDKHRFAYLDRPAQLKRYERIQSEGCCGFFDKIVIVNGRPAKIGCNFGH